MYNLLLDEKYFRKPKREKKSFYLLPAGGPNGQPNIFSVTKANFFPLKFMKEFVVTMN